MSTDPTKGEVYWIPHYVIKFVSDLRYIVKTNYISNFLLYYAVFPVFRLLTDFVCLCTYEFWLSLWKIARCSLMLLLPLFHIIPYYSTSTCVHFRPGSGGIRAAHLLSFLCCVFFYMFVFALCLVHPMLPVTLHCQYLIGPSVYLQTWCYIDVVTRYLT